MALTTMNMAPRYSFLPKKCTDGGVDLFLQPSRSQQKLNRGCNHLEDRHGAARLSPVIGTAQATAARASLPTNGFGPVLFDRQEERPEAHTINYLRPIMVYSSDRGHPKRRRLVNSIGRSS
jgi:hypothetical protein